jgi:hypothetical protein
MTNPALVDLTQNEWTKVATNVTNAQVGGQSPSVNFLLTLRDTGQAAPSNSETDEGRPFGEFGLVVQNTTAVDVYVWTDSDLGTVLVHA